MAENTLSDTNPTAPATLKQEAPRKSIVGGSVTDDERNRIVASFEQAGFRTVSEGVREILLAHVESASVRDAVAAWRRANLAPASA
jgi:hypothetical protein